MANVLSIEQFRGTPLYALAQNANVNGGTTLDAQEQAMFQSQMKNMGWTPEQFGLTVETTDNAGETAKETRKNMETAADNLEKSYKSQFGKQGAKAAETAELRADSMVRTAYDMFNAEHPNSRFTPQTLGARPKYTAPEYKNDVSTYAADLAVWANGVKQEYMMATKMSNEALAAMIMNNNNVNTARAVQDNREQHKQTQAMNAEQHSKTRAANAAEEARTRKEMYSEFSGVHDHIDGVEIREMYRDIHYEWNEIDRHAETNRNINRATNAIIENQDKNAEDINNNIDEESKKVQELIKQKGAEVIDTLDPLYIKRAVKGLRDAAIAAGKSVIDFVNENPGFLFLGIPGYILIDKCGVK